VNLFCRAPGSSSTAGLSGAAVCDALKMVILLTTVWLFSWIDTSVLYHVVKSQSVIKLYIFFNMLEVGDRLFASFVQDTIGKYFLYFHGNKLKCHDNGI
jgi:low temperature requirement protein LtrA